jgi:hypothetical protein
MTETTERASVPLNRQARKNQPITSNGFDWRQLATKPDADRHTDLPARSHRIETTQLASVPPQNGTLGTLACSSSVPVCHTRKGGKRHASPANCGEVDENAPIARCGTGRIESVRFVLANLDDAETLARSRRFDSAVRSNGQGRG